jgi:hypothetical protein
MPARVVNPTHLSDLAGRGLVTRAGSGTAARERTLPLLPVFSALVPQAAVQRGSVVACTGAAALSLALALAAGPSQEGAWVGVVGLPSLGLAAAVEAGVALERLVAVSEPVDAAGAAHPFSDTQWADLLAACIDGFDVLLLGPGAQQVRPGTARRLVARLQARGAVAITAGAPVFGADLRFECTSSTWMGLGDGYGVAQGRVAEVALSGRRVPQTRHGEFWLPSADGRVRAVGVPQRERDGADAGSVVVPLRRTG